MVKVITYGTYDMFHYGHQRLLERAKALGLNDDEIREILEILLGE